MPLVIYESIVGSPLPLVQKYGQGDSCKKQRKILERHMKQAAEAWFNRRVFKPTFNHDRLLMVSYLCLSALSWWKQLAHLRLGIALGSVTRTEVVTTDTSRLGWGTVWNGRGVQGDAVTMSRRRISCKELGQVDCQGWLYRKRETKGFIGIKWKKYWFVLKRTSLYWYSSHTAEKAEGFINLTDFTVDQATECRKKHAIKARHPQIRTFYFAAESPEEMNNAIKARHPQIRTFYFAAESPEEMNKWLKKLKKGLASIRCEPPAEAVCEDRQSWLDIINSSQASSARQSLTCSVQIHSKHPQPDSSDPAGDSSLNPISRSQDSLHEELLNPTSCADPEKEVSLPGSVESEGCITISDPSLILYHDTTLGDRLVHWEWGMPPVPEPASSDEMEKLYKSLEQASLSPIGERKPSTRKEFRKSFIKRCKNQAVNDKLHQIRTLNSTLKAREDDLMTIAQVLEKPSLTAQEYREWKEINLLLLQEICQNYQPHTEGKAKAPDTASTPASH
ncbi:UNVERIFIED_CONTAM: hypothetical protein FKN15_001170 [Acipenser sinensis]